MRRGRRHNLSTPPKAMPGALARVTAHRAIVRYAGRRAKGGIMQLDPQTFTLTHRQHRLSNEQLAAALRAFADRCGGRTFTREQFDEWCDRPCAAATVAARFGSWRRALLTLGLRAKRGYDYEAEEMVAELEAVWRRLGRAPGKAVFRRMSRLSPWPYKRRWGSLGEVCRRLALYHGGAMSREELLAAAPVGRVRAGVRPSQRWRILARDGHRCRICGRGAAGAGQGRAPVTLHIDHIVPVSMGGGEADENLRVLCSECNLGRSDRAG